MEIDILAEDPAWDAAGLEALAAQAIAATLAALDLPTDRFAVSLLGCDDARIADLNAEFRGKPAPTNVLSWPAEAAAPRNDGMPALPAPPRDGPPHELGDIAIAHGICTREAAAQGKPFADHVRHLLVHGTLHLLGFDHITDEDARAMESLETRVLATLGVSDPY